MDIDEEAPVGSQPQAGNNVPREEQQQQQPARPSLQSLLQGGGGSGNIMGQMLGQMSQMVY